MRRVVVREATPRFDPGRTLGTAAEGRRRGRWRGGGGAVDRNRVTLEYIAGRRHSQRGYEMRSEQVPTLYDRLGGVYNIATVVDDLIDRVMSDARLNKNPAVDEAHHRVTPAGFKFLVTEMVCWAAGGPQEYSGRPMGDSHRHLGITEDEWAAFIDDVDCSLERFKVPTTEQQEILAIVESTKDAIVISSRRPGGSGPPNPPAT
jgi:hemoglobin